MSKRGKGRPTKYGPKILEQTETYLLTYEKLGDAIASVVGLARYLKISTRTIQRWAKDEGEKSQFCRTLEMIEDQQHYDLLNKGLRNEINPMLSKLALANHGYAEATKQELMVDAKSLDDYYED